MSNLHQGDQLALRIRVAYGNTVVTPENSEGIKIQIANIMHKYPGGDLSFDSETNRWLFPVTQEQSLLMYNYVDTQVQVNFGGNTPVIRSSKKLMLPVDVCIIKELWDDD